WLPSAWGLTEVAFPTASWAFEAFACSANKIANVSTEIQLGLCIVLTPLAHTGAPVRGCLVSPYQQKSSSLCDVVHTRSTARHWPKAQLQEICEADEKRSCFMFKTWPVTAGTVAGVLLCWRTCRVR